MNQLQSKEDYLERILMLSKKLEVVHAIDIAKSMGFSKPSVSIALKKLKEHDHIEVHDDGSITLTESGVRIATRIYERHTVIKELFMLLGVEETIAEKDACDVEHEISDVTFEALKVELQRKKAGK